MAFGKAFREATGSKHVPYSELLQRCVERGKVLKSCLLDESLVFGCRAFASLCEKSCYQDVVRWLTGTSLAEWKYTVHRPEGKSRPAN